MNTLENVSKNVVYAHFIFQITWDHDLYMPMLLDGGTGGICFVICQRLHLIYSVIYELYISYGLGKCNVEELAGFDERSVNAYN